MQTLPESAVGIVQLFLVLCLQECLEVAQLAVHLLRHLLAHIQLNLVAPGRVRKKPKCKPN
jgi:hypothetical protein